MAPSATNLKAAKVTGSIPLHDADARWVKLKKITYADPHGKTRDWESAERTTRPAGSDIDGVGIIAILKKKDEKTGNPREEIMLQKQFRPPVDNVCIEVPAGLIDAGETAEECAVRELREETGFVGTAREVSCVMFNDPGFCNTNLRLVRVEVDMSLPENQNPQPKLEENEFIEVFTVPLETMWEEMKRLEREGYAIDARIGTIAEGVELAKRLGIGMGEGLEV